jgi:hypothetical protein
MNLEIKLDFQSLVYKYLVHDVTLHHAAVLIIANALRVTVET